MMRRFIDWMRRLVDPVVFNSAGFQQSLIPPVEEYRDPQKFKQLSEWAAECRAAVHKSLSARPRPVSRPKDAPD